MLVNSFRPIFDARRKELLEQGFLSPFLNAEDSSNVIPPYSKMDVFYQIADILTKNNVLPEDVLDIIGQLASTIAMIEGKSLDPVSEEKLKEIENKISNHIYGQILNGLDTVRLKQGMIKTN